MATEILPRDEVFLDTSYAIALVSSTDAVHEKAVQIALEMKRKKVQIVTTRAVLLEIGNALSRQRFRSTSVELLEALETDESVEIIPLTDECYLEAFDLYNSRMDKEWGLIDCISFLVMQARGITKALTADDHFRQCGFTALLLDDPN